MINFIHNVPVIYYHSVAPKKHLKWIRNWLTLELKYFKLHLEYFKKKGYQSLFLSEYFDVIKQKEKGKYFVLTFDDGYLDNYIYVYPLLKEYGFKGTIFISPEFVDGSSKKRKTLFDYWNNNATLKEIDNWGFLNWEEMREMVKSGVIDIQSHTMTHTKYFVSDKLIDFHHPGVDSLYYIGNLFPERKPYYIINPEFETLLPYGYPVFEQKSAVTTLKIDINPLFIDKIVQAFKDIDWAQPYNFNTLYEKVKNIYIDFREGNEIIKCIEGESEYKKRVYNELKESKDLLENKLDKKIEFLCWPHGDNNAFTHQTALEVGYKATTLGKMSNEYSDETRFDRTGIGIVKNSSFLTKLKTRYKIDSYRGEQPYKFVKNVYEYFRDLRE